MKRSTWIDQPTTTGKMAIDDRGSIGINEQPKKMKATETIYK